LALERRLIGGCAAAGAGADYPNAGPEHRDGGDEQECLVISGERHAPKMWRRRLGTRIV
jgi:hypothetical protein